MDKNARKAVMGVLEISQNTYYVWKREGRPIIKLLEQYFTPEELIEFVETKTLKQKQNIYVQKELKSFVKNSAEDFFYFFQIKSFKGSLNLPLKTLNIYICFLHWLQTKFIGVTSYNHYKSFKNIGMIYLAQKNVEQKQVENFFLPFFDYLEQNVQAGFYLQIDLPHFFEQAVIDNIIEAEIQKQLLLNYINKKEITQKTIEQIKEQIKEEGKIN